MVKKFEAESQPLAPVQGSTVATQSRVQRLAELGQSLQELNAAARPIAQRAVSERAQTEGREAALAGEFTPRKDASFAAAEFNRAGFNTALSELEISMRSRVYEIFREAKHDPAALKTRFDAHRAEMEEQLQGMDELLPQFRAMYARATQPLLSQSADNYERTLKATDAAKAMQVLEMRMNDAERFARVQQIDPTAQQALLEESQQFDAVLVEHGPKEGFTFRGVEYPPDPTRSGNFEPTDMERISQDWAERMEEAAIMGGFDRAGDKEKYLAAFEKRERGRKGSPFSMDQVDQLANRMQVEINKADARTNAAKSQLSKQITEAEKVFEAGKTPSNLLPLRKAAANFPDLLGKLDAAQQDMRHAATFGALKPVDQRAVLNKLQNVKEASAREVELQKRLERIHTDTVQLLQNDPVQLLSRNQVMDVTPIDLANPASFADRADEAATLQAYYGIRHHGLTEAEVSGLSQILEANTADANAAYLGAIRGGMDDDRLTALLKELMPKNPEFAAAAGIADTRPDIAADILRGVDILKTETGITPPAADILTITDDYFGDAVTGGNRAMLERAAVALDAQRRARAGLKSKDQFDPDDFEQALDDITGGVYRWHGKKIIAPAPGVDQDTFEDMVDALTQDDIKGAMIPDPLTGLLRQVDIAQFRKVAKLQSTSAGRYLIFLGDGFLQDEAGKPYELDLGAKLPDLNARIRRAPSFMGASLPTTPRGS
jgi:hypothetical protein